MKQGEKSREFMLDAARRDVSTFTRDYDETFFAEDGLSQLRFWLKDNAASAPQVSDSVRLGAPICRPSKIVCIGLSFHDHAKESHMGDP